MGRGMVAGMAGNTTEPVPVYNTARQAVRQKAVEGSVRKVGVGKEKVWGWWEPHGHSVGSKAMNHKVRSAIMGKVKVGGV